VREDCKEFKIYGKGKDIIKNVKLCVVTNLSLISPLDDIVFVLLFLRRKPAAEIVVVSAETACWEIARK
jgi:hypothetical protein